MNINDKRRFDHSILFFSFTELGHNVRIITPQFVKPYVKSNKNDAADAEAICEAMQRPSMRFVPTKTNEACKLLLTGGRTVVRVADKHDDRRNNWIKELDQRRGKNKSAVAVANKNARNAGRTIYDPDFPGAFTLNILPIYLGTLSANQTRVYRHFSKMNYKQYSSLLFIFFMN